METKAWGVFLPTVVSFIIFYLTMSSFRSSLVVSMFLAPATPAALRKHPVQNFSPYIAISYINNFSLSYISCFFPALLLHLSSLLFFYCPRLPCRPARTAILEKTEPYIHKHKRKRKRKHKHKHKHTYIHTGIFAGLHASRPIQSPPTLRPDPRHNSPYILHFNQAAHTPSYHLHYLPVLGTGRTTTNSHKRRQQHIKPSQVKHELYPRPQP